MNEKAPFNTGDVVSFTIRTSLAGQERKVDYCKRHSNIAWKVYFTDGGWDWEENLELAIPAMGSPMIQPPVVHNWPMGYCDNGFGHEGEHPLYTSSDNGCKNFVTSERLLEIKQLFDAAQEIENLIIERDRALEDVEILLQQHLMNQPLPYSPIIITEEGNVELEWRRNKVHVRIVIPDDDDDCRYWVANQETGELISGFVTETPERLRDEMIKLTW